MLGYTVCGNSVRTIEKCWIKDWLCIAKLLRGNELVKWSQSGPNARHGCGGLDLAACVKRRTDRTMLTNHVLDRKFLSLITEPRRTTPTSHYRKSFAQRDTSSHYTPPRLMVLASQLQIETVQCFDKHRFWSSHYGAPFTGSRSRMWKTGCANAGPEGPEKTRIIRGELVRVTVM